jgi:hypothetical protein
MFRVVFVVLISYKRLHPFKFAQGKATFVNQNMKTLKSVATTKIGLRIRMMDIPALFRAVNSKFSPNFPKVIREESNIAKGKASGTVIKEK